MNTTRVGAGATTPQTPLPGSDARRPAAVGLAPSLSGGGVVSPRRASRQPAEQLPPHSDEAEAGILGCVLLGAAAEKLSLDYFYDLRNRTIAQALLTMHREQAPVGVATLGERLRRDGQLEPVGGLERLNKLEDLAPSAANFSYWEGILKEHAATRLALRVFAESADALKAHPEQAGNIARHAAEALANVGHGRNGSFTLRKPDDLLAMTFDESDNLLGDRLWSTGQSLVIAGASSIGKSRLLLQLAVASITGRDFVGLTTRGADRRWLILQAENSNRRLKQDLEALRAWTGPGAWAAVNERLTLHTLEADTDGFLALEDPETVRRLADIIGEIKPDNVGFDSLYSFTAGDLNLDQDMRATLTAISRLVKTGNPQRSAVVLHHALTGRAGASKATGFERGSFGRNSKVLHAWARGQVNVAPGAADSNDLLVLACGKCSNGREFPPFAIRLNPSTLIYEPEPGFDFDAWQGELSGRADNAPLITPDRVRKLCRGPMTKQDLAKAIQADCGCPRQNAYRYLARAEKARSVRFNSKEEVFNAL